MIRRLLKKFFGGKEPTRIKYVRFKHTEECLWCGGQRSVWVFDCWFCGAPAIVIKQQNERKR